MLQTKAYSNLTDYLFVVTNGTEENTFEYRWGKEPSEGQDLQTYLQNNKREAELLAQYEIDKKAPPQEIVI